MKLQITFAFFALCFAHYVGGGVWPQGAAHKEQPAAFSFAGVGYFHRFTKDDQNEYTPDGQTDLQAWTDMVTINRYRQATNGEALAATANAVLENYKANQAVVVKTDSIPGVGRSPPEHLIVVIFPRPEFVEVAFARFNLHGGAGAAVIYSHRIYGNKVGDRMSAWLKQNGAATEQTLMAWDAFAKLPAAK